MFENRSQQSKMEVNARTERSQNSSHEQTCFLLKKHSSTSPEIQFKKLKEDRMNLEVLYLTSRSVQQYQPKH